MKVKLSMCFVKRNGEWRYRSTHS